MVSKSDQWTKKKLAVELSKLEGFEKVNVTLEQYATPSEIAADWLWNAALQGDIVGKVSADAACGPGILGCGALLLGAEKAVFIDISKDALELARKNINKLETEFEIGKSEFICANISEWNGKVDTILQNPPFGTKMKHHDKRFLEKAFQSADVIYSLHKAATSGFVEAIVKDHQFTITHTWNYNFKLKQTLPWHKLKYFEVNVMLWRLISTKKTKSES
jgi:putative methylase